AGRSDYKSCTAAQICDGSVGPDARCPRSSCGSRSVAPALLRLRNGRATEHQRHVDLDPFVHFQDAEHLAEPADVIVLEIEREVAAHADGIAARPDAPRQSDIACDAVNR